MAETFTYRSARSGSFVAGISAAILIETAALHFALVGRHPIIAWTLTVFNAAAIAWLVRDYVAMGRGAVTLEPDTLRLRIGSRFDVAVPASTVAAVLRPTYRDLPTPGTNQGRDYVSLTRPATPNVLIVLDQPMPVRLPGGVRRQTKRFGLHVDDPDGFIARLSS